MSQSRAQSLVESLINVLIGCSINMTANVFVYPLFGWHITMGQNLAVACIYTAISIVRSYAIRRWFNARIHRLAEKITN
ncbi:MAG: hypothetical protein E6R03_05535 [Hyphomicrobiaceae bacterium]|nr:MAG: hypothetical protein E6R03_05535 [Hyphomicrobiaceae bacterium]